MMAAPDTIWRGSERLLTSSSGSERHLTSSSGSERHLISSSGSERHLISSSGSEHLLTSSSGSGRPMALSDTIGSPLTQSSESMRITDSVRGRCLNQQAFTLHWSCNLPADRGFWPLESLQRKHTRADVNFHSMVRIETKLTTRRHERLKGGGANAFPWLFENNVLFFCSSALDVRMGQNHLHQN